jgi:hypothetical protein
MSTDPTVTNPDLYDVVMENERVRVLEYRDRPGDRTTPHVHPDSVMITLSAFRRRLIDGDRAAEVDLAPGLVRNGDWEPRPATAPRRSAVQLDGGTGLTTESRSES